MMKKWFLTFKIIFQFILHPSSSYFSTVDRVYKAELRKKPKDPYLLWFLSNQYVRHEKYSEAQFFLESLLSLGKRKRGVILLLSKVYFKLEKYNEVITLLENYEDLRDVDLHNYYLGASFVNLDKYNEAISYLKKYVQNYPNEYIPFMRLGFAYYKIEQYGLALKAYQKGRTVCPEGEDSKILESIKLCSEKLGQANTIH